MMLCQARTIIGLISLLLCLCPLSEANVEIGTEVATTDKALQGAQTGTFGSMPSESSLFSGLNYHEDFVEEITVKQHDSWSHKSRGTLPSVLSMQAPPQVLVITVDGSLHSVDLATGLLNWSKPFGPIISGTPQDETTASDDNPIFVPDAATGRIYVAQPGSSLKEMPYRIQDLARSSASVTPDGHVVLVETKSRMVAIDISTGDTLSTFSSDGSAQCQDEMSDTVGPHVIHVTLTDYRLLVREADAIGSVKVNMTYTEMSRPEMKLSEKEARALNITSTHRKLFVVDSQLLYGNIAEAKLSWAANFDSPVVSVLFPDARGLLQQIPFERVQPSAMGVSDKQFVKILRLESGIIFAQEVQRIVPISLFPQHIEELDQQPESSLVSFVESSSCKDQNLPWCHSHGSSLVESLPSPAGVPLLTFENANAIELAPEQEEKRQVSVTFLVVAVVCTLAIGAFSATMVLTRTGRLSRGGQDTELANDKNEEEEEEEDEEEEDKETEAQLVLKNSFNFPVEIGKMIVTDRVLGHGSSGTIVYKGVFEGGDIAIKRVLREYTTVAEHEVDLLRRSDHHPNVIRYFCLETDSHFSYIGLELCVATLLEVVEGPRISTRGTTHGAHADLNKLAQLDRRQLATDFLSGLAFLHDLNIVHRDVKPNNVLISQRYRAVISDFGLCKALKEDQSSFNPTMAGTCGWVAPELLKGQRATKAVDIFSAGCVLHYLFHGVHPFGPYYERESNIRKAKLKLTKHENKLLDNLLHKMLHARPRERFTIDQVLAHPYFWSSPKLLGFLMDVSDRVEREPFEGDLVQEIEQGAKSVVGDDWRKVVSDSLLEDLQRFRKYRWNSVVDLLRAARNKKHHYQELPPALKASLGDLPDGFLRYFTSRFPRLAPHLYDKVMETGLQREAMFKPYFP